MNPYTIEYSFHTRIADYDVRAILLADVEELFELFTSYRVHITAFIDFQDMREEDGMSPDLEHYNYVHDFPLGINAQDVAGWVKEQYDELFESLWHEQLKFEKARLEFKLKFVNTLLELDSMEYLDRGNWNLWIYPD